MKPFGKLEIKIENFLNSTRGKMGLSRLTCMAIGITIFIAGYAIDVYFCLGNMTLYWTVAAMFGLPSIFFISLAKSGISIDE